VKNLIVCCDGTWNTPDQEEHELPAPTNVVKLKNCLADTVSDPNAGQLVYYHPGVGTEGGPLKRMAGGAWGQGLSKNIQSAYQWLAREYAPGDRVYLFGFSRGAYTVRSLAGFMNKCGLLDLDKVGVKEGWQRVETAYQQGYRDGIAKTKWAEDWHWHHKSKAPVHFVGVWDTVGALGIPDDLAILNLIDTNEHWRFHDTALGANIGIARHAVALDEMRASFTPTLWDHAKRRDVKQVWFPGVHADVGGGYAVSGLSDVSLHWMIEEARAAGLAFKPEMVSQLRADPLAVLHDSMKGIFKTQRSRPRNTPLMSEDEPSLHPAALARHATPPINQSPYRLTKRLTDKPMKIEIYARERWNTTGIWLEPGTYQFSAEGEWLDRSIPAGPGGASDGEFHLSEIAHLLSSGLGWIERGWQGVTGNDAADFKLTKRHEQWDWMALVGVVANSRHLPGPDGSPAQHTHFLIGDKATVKIDNGGYFYAYANDAWDFYDNNSGAVTLTIKRIKPR
jgi:uncharacterized protein (DUF2235 family)